MIHTAQRKKLKQVLGNRYSSKVLEILKEQHIVNRNGKPYGTSMIRNVFNGLNENILIENAIWELFIRHLKTTEQREDLKNQLLNLPDT